MHLHWQCGCADEAAIVTVIVFTQASEATRAAARQLSSTLGTLREEVAHGSSELLEGVQTLMGKEGRPSPASSPSTGVAPTERSGSGNPLLHALSVDPADAAGFKEWVAEHDSFSAEEIEAAKKADTAIPFAYVGLR